ncbi:MAG TPA: HD domain-containing phosphohydrolase [Burkholderiaceae bacterium]|nr:HD domain-containing phosphohydrolase [Burkholderiaceae bacterium]
MFDAPTVLTQPSWRIAESDDAFNFAREFAHECPLAELEARMHAHDPRTFQHMRRVSRITMAIAHTMGLDAPRVDALGKAGFWHDIGKLIVPNALLNKSATLDAIELVAMRAHPQAGRALIECLDFAPHERAVVLDAALYHHERLDGSGYPTGRAGHDIPLAARIVSVADVYDALITHRPYRDAMPVSQAMAMVERDVGTRFCGEVVAALGTLVHAGRCFVSD